MGGGSVCTSPALAPTPWAPIRAACTPGFPPHQPQLRLGVGGGAPAPPPSIPPKVLPGTRVPRRGWPSPCPAFCLWGFSLVGAGLFWRGEEGRDLPDPLIGEGSCPHRKQSFQSQPLHYLAGRRGPEGQVAGEGATLRPRVRRQQTEDEALSGAGPGGRVLLSPGRKTASSISQAPCARLSAFLRIPAQA